MQTLNRLLMSCALTLIAACSNSSDDFVPPPTGAAPPPAAVAPTITTQPASVSVMAGQTATFQVAATGTAPLTYQWQRNGTNIAAATAATYTTPATTIGDSGATFSAVVSNSAGSATSNSASLTVMAGAAALYVKASNTGADDLFGVGIALSADGDFMAVGACCEDSSATGIGGDQSNNASVNSGAVYIFVRDAGGAWSQQAYLKASNAGAGDRFGYSVALSFNGSTLVVGAPEEDSAATGINGNGADNSASNSGAAYVFVRDGSTWSQQAYLKASNTNADDDFGRAVAIDPQGDTVAVTAQNEASAATGINGDGSNNAAAQSGAAYVYARSGTTWSQQAYVKPSNTDAGDQFGRSVALSGDARLAVGAWREDSNASGINGNGADDSAFNSGAVYLFGRNAQDVWVALQYVKASNPEANDSFGFSLAFVGETLAVGAFFEASNATGVNGNQADNTAIESGAVYVFVESGNSWTQQAYLKASNTEAGDRFGFSVGLSSDGNRLAIGAPNESSNATGVGGSQGNNSADESGAVYVFARTGSVWSQLSYVKASNTGVDDIFGWLVALSADGLRLLVGAPGEDGAATGINGDQTSNAADGSGAVYLY
jgi:hypothetical protein